MTRLTRIAALAAIMGGALTSPAWAHTGVGLFGQSGFAAGFLHPLMGLDHELAMLGVGVWAVQLGRRAIWLVPLSFVTVMIVGAIFGIMGAPLPMVEFGIGGSVLVIGALIALGTRMPVALAMAMVGAFAFFHGHAHGTELPGFAHPAAYGAGFVFATSLLHAAGIAIAWLVRRHAARLPFRAAGAAMALVGLGLLMEG
ncbi:MAG TPA: HupE/UreJ family protein [Dongiaceae bacterium]|nr:HupE/UreJ family protein [Dongiaceae bacterium]